jgi:hypothetical protein
MADPIDTIIGEEMTRPVAPAVTAAAQAVRAPHERAAVAVLFYGSCLRVPEADLADNLLDFYVIVDDYRAAYDRRWLAVANRLLPPNAFYREAPMPDGAGQGGTIRAKYVVISLDDFARACAPETRNVSIWARFAQPARIVWVRDAAGMDRVLASCGQAVRTMFRNAWPLEPTSRDAATIWTRAFRETYAAELRPETAGRAQHIFDADRGRYEALTPLLIETLRQPYQSRATAEAAWRGRRRLGKTLNLARIVKGTFTFDGGLDYALWKIRRHSGVTVPVSEWQRRHPLLAAPGLAWRLYRMGAFR